MYICLKLMYFSGYVILFLYLATNKAWLRARFTSKYSKNWSKLNDQKGVWVSNRWVFWSV